MRKLRLLIFSCGELGKQHKQLDSEYIRSKNVCAIAQVVSWLHYVSAIMFNPTGFGVGEAMKHNNREADSEVG